MNIKLKKYIIPVKIMQDTSIEVIKLAPKKPEISILEAVFAAIIMYPTIRIINQVI